jgi:hypothetical protein
MTPNPSLESGPAEAGRQGPAGAGCNIGAGQALAACPVGSAQLARYTAQNTIPCAPRPRRARLAGRVGTTAQRRRGPGRRRLVARRPKGRAKNDQPVCLSHAPLRPRGDPGKSWSQLGDGRPRSLTLACRAGHPRDVSNFQGLGGRSRTIGTAARTVWYAGRMFSSSHCAQSGAQCQAWHAGS